MLISLAFAMSHKDIPRVVIPHRDLMPPPNLARNTPIADAFQPIGINFSPSVWIKNGFPGAVSCQGLLGKRFHFDKPLLRQIWLHHGIATITMANGMKMRVSLNKKSLRFKVGNDSFTCFKPVHTLVGTALFINRTVRTHNVDSWQMMAVTHFKVVGIMSRCHFDDASPKFGIYKLVGNN